MKITKSGNPKPPKFTPAELMGMFGLTVEEALAKGYKVVKSAVPPKYTERRRDPHAGKVEQA